MRTVLLGVFLIAASGAIKAADSKEEEQDKSYVECLLKRKVDPPNIQQDDIVYCLGQAEIDVPSDKMHKEKWSLWRDCLIEKAVELDDEISPAADIAKAIIVFCPNEWRGFVAASALNHSARRDMASGLMKYGVSDGIQAVLRTRKVKKQLQPQSQEAKK